MEEEGSGTIEGWYCSFGGLDRQMARCWHQGMLTYPIPQPSYSKYIINYIYCLYIIL